MNPDANVMASVNVNVLPLADTELPVPLILHWLFCKLLVDGSNIGVPLA